MHRCASGAVFLPPAQASAERANDPAKLQIAHGGEDGAVELPLAHRALTALTGD